MRSGVGVKGRPGRALKVTRMLLDITLRRETTRGSQPRVT